MSGAKESSCISKSVPRTAEEVRLVCDVLVIGSGTAGICAAIEAGRSGVDTILMEKDPVLGGNGGPLLGVGITGADRYAHYAAETGIVHELQEEGAWIDAWGAVRSGAYTISRRFEALLQSKLEEAGVRVLKNHYVREPVMDGSRIVGVIAHDLSGFRKVGVQVRHAVVEASGDGETAWMAGADFDTGREAAAETGERSAPEKRNSMVQGSSLVVLAVNGENPVRFTPPPGTPQMRARLWEGSLNTALHHSHDHWLRNKGFRIDLAKDERK
jgi:glycerol-3-phosphate dehydrogenase